MHRVRTVFISVILAAAAVAGVAAWGASVGNSDAKHVVADLGWNAAGTGH